MSAADLLGSRAEIGSLEPGELADVVAVPGHPLKDIRVTQCEIRTEGRCRVYRTTAALSMNLLCTLKLND